MKKEIFFERDLIFMKFFYLFLKNEKNEPKKLKNEPKNEKIKKKITKK
jgi:hypothetical protein